MAFNNVISFVLLLVPLLFTVQAVTNPEVEDQSGFSYDPRAPNGPQNWGNLNPNWTLCRTGRSQSPIDIVDRRTVNRPSLGDLIRQYQPATAVLKNRGHDLEVEWTGNAGGIVIHGTNFELVQAHWHIPAEHEIDGDRENMELHIVHMSVQGYIAVVAFIYDLGHQDPFIEQFVIPNLPANPQGVNLGIVNPEALGYIGREYYRYNGSLTTPPCSENVTWTVFKREKTVSLRQLRAMKQAVGNKENARPIQPLNGRIVYKYRP